MYVDRVDSELAGTVVEVEVEVEMPGEMHDKETAEAATKWTRRRRRRIRKRDSCWHPVSRKVRYGTPEAGSRVRLG